MLSSAGIALDAERMRVTGPVTLGFGFTASGARAAGVVNFYGSVVGALHCEGAMLRSEDGPALNAEMVM